MPRRDPHASHSGDIHCCDNRQAFNAEKRSQIDIENMDYITFTQALTLSFGIGIVAGTILLIVIEAIEYFDE